MKKLLILIIVLLSPLQCIAKNTSRQAACNVVKEQSELLIALKEVIYGIKEKRIIENILFKIENVLTSYEKRIELLENQNEKQLLALEEIRKNITIASEKIRNLDEFKERLIGGTVTLITGLIIALANFLRTKKRDEALMLMAKQKV